MPSRSWAPTILAGGSVAAPSIARQPAGAESSDGAASEEPGGLLDEPLLPEEGLAELETWERLGRALLDSAVDYLPQLLAALFLFFVFYVASRIVASVTRRALSRTRADPAARQVVTKLASIAVLIVGVLVAASQAGVAVGSMIASVGVAGLAIGLAAQDSLSNVVAGLTILWDRPFRVGDYVTVADEYGRVTDVGLRTTTIETVRKVEAILPNSDVINSKIINHTRTPDLRVDLSIGIGYGEDVAQAREVLIEALSASSYTAKEPAPSVVLRELGDSAVVLAARVWLNDPSAERRASWDLLERAKVALDEAGIEIPFPQRTLHMASTSPPLRLGREHGSNERAASDEAAGDAA